MLPQIRRREFLTALAAGAALAGCAGLRGAAAPRARVIDAHAHWFPPEWERLNEPDSRFQGNGSMNVPAIKSLDARLKIMDEQGVDVHALSHPTQYVYQAPPERGLLVARIFNDACSAAHAAHPQRFVGLAMLPMQAPEVAAKELERAAALPGMRGVHLSTNVNGKNLDDASFLPVYALCEKLGWAIFLHPGNTIGADRTRSYYLSNLLGNPYDTGVAAASLVFGGVMDRFPRLQVMLPHAGGTFPWLSGRLDRGVETRRELAHMQRPASAYLRRFHYDTIAHDARIMGALVRLVGADRIVLGSDYNFDMGYPRPVEFVDGLKELGAPEREMILGGNAARLLAL
jgi:aminocarboxymuconate-semialdehyde decarboxylase